MPGAMFHAVCRFVSGVTVHVVCAFCLGCGAQAIATVRCEALPLHVPTRRVDEQHKPSGCGGSGRGKVSQLSGLPWVVV